MRVPCGVFGMYSDEPSIQFHIFSDQSTYVWLPV